MNVATKITVTGSELTKLLADWYSENGEDTIADIISNSSVEDGHRWSRETLISFGRSISPIKSWFAEIDNDIISEAVQRYCVKNGTINPEDKISVSYLDVEKRREDKETVIEFYAE